MALLALELEGEALPVTVMESDVKTDVHSSILVLSPNLDLRADLRTHAPVAVLRTVQKYSESVRAATIHFSRERRVYCCEINVQTVGAGVLIGEASGLDAREVFLTALRKAGKQLRRRRRALETDRAAPPPTQTPSSVSA
jgi:hypothetical protein